MCTQVSTFAQSYRGRAPAALFVILAAKSEPTSDMGRRRISIEPIEQRKRRSITFNKRRLGLFKKADELSSLCSCQVMVVLVYEGRIYQFSSRDSSVTGLMLRYINESSQRGIFQWKQPTWDFSIKVQFASFTHLTMNIGWLQTLTLELEVLVQVKEGVFSFLNESYLESQCSNVYIQIGSLLQTTLKVPSGCGHTDFCTLSMGDPRHFSPGLKGSLICAPPTWAIIPSVLPIFLIEFRYAWRIFFGCTLSSFRL